MLVIQKSEGVVGGRTLLRSNRIASPFLRDAIPMVISSFRVSLPAPSTYFLSKTTTARLAARIKRVLVGARVLPILHLYWSVVRATPHPSLRDAVVPAGNPRFPTCLSRRLLQLSQKSECTLPMGTRRIMSQRLERTLSSTLKQSERPGLFSEYS